MRCILWENSSLCIVHMRVFFNDGGAVAHLFVHPNYPFIIRRDRLILALPHTDDIATGQLRRKHVLKRFANIDATAAGVFVFVFVVSRAVCPPIRTR